MRDLLGKEAGETRSYFKDSDSDGIKDFFDKCPCDIGEEAYDGCKEKCKEGSPIGRSCIK